jgi:hypothetical protein
MQGPSTSIVSKYRLAADRKFGTLDRHKSPCKVCFNIAAHPEFQLTTYATRSWSLDTNTEGNRANDLYIILPETPNENGQFLDSLVDSLSLPIRSVKD